MLKYLGLSSDDSNGTLPIWQGVDKKKRAFAFLGSFVLAAAMYFLTSWLLSDVQQDSFAKYVPGIFASMTLLLATVISERSLLRAKEKTGHHEDER
ncbi:hypothetical protein [Glutamicibacter mishrai]|uniref:hypothetical protein n=1 Tax=Glutamicibacter mishrai TaxID=1775880 RepID=UPI003F7A8719